MTALVLLLGLTTGRAADVNVRFDLDDARTRQLGLDTQEIEDDLNERMSSELRLDDVETFLDSMANAAAIASKGMGVDYASNMKRVVFGGSLGSGAHAAGLKFKRGTDTLPEGGFAGQVSMMVGLNLGALGAGEDSFARRVRIYANGLYLPMPSASPFDGVMYNAGAHLQIKIINGGDGKLVEWGGFDLTTGYDRSFYEISLSKTLKLKKKPVSWTANGDYSISSGNGAVPVELSTNLRLAVLTVYAGGGVDLNTGESTGDAQLHGPVKTGITGTSERLGTASVGLTETGAADPIVPRIFVGAQANVAFLKAFGHLNVGLNDSVGGHVGARMAF